mmetsp:Transcript_17810/g.17038  ORF Transcript_17810/g.17038 Transcript_17810/m.17038 type:complete len:100 (-) Transcript_17810:27-326(-)
MEEAVELGSYMHFRNVQKESYKENLNLPGAPFNPRFLECLTEDDPKGLWSIQKNPNGWNVHIRSLYWPGFAFYHSVRDKKFGSFYLGDGLKNDQLHFMI